MRVAITGKPGTGKTTLCLKVYEALRDILDVRGFVTEEIREGGVRVGFEIVDLKSGERFSLARVGEGFPRVGKYVVYVESVDRVSERILSDYSSADLTVIDEVGPMELKSRSFVSAMSRLVEAQDNLLVTVHYCSTHPLVLRIKKEFRVFEITRDNRDSLVREVLNSLDS
ncbi:NTPase [Geoglobus sp.]